MDILLINFVFKCFIDVKQDFSDKFPLKGLLFSS